MTREKALSALRAHRADIEAFGVSKLAIFGSVARGEDRDESDVDILVEFSAPVGLFEFVRLKRYLQDLLGRPVDLATPDALRDQMRPQILREAVYATY